MNEMHSEAIDTETVFCMNLFDEDEEDSNADDTPQEDNSDTEDNASENLKQVTVRASIIEDFNGLAPFQLDQEILFKELITQHQRRLYRFVIKYIDHPDDAADITQQAFVEAARTISNFRGDSKLSTWLFGIAMNMVRNYQLARYTVTSTVFSALIKEMSDSLKGAANKIG
ncbi:MAG: hypothetical protein RL678_818 [Pseudomonadota bacterium]|jgi:hypothetical protein